MLHVEIEIKIICEIFKYIDSIRLLSIQLLESPGLNPAVWLSDWQALCPGVWIYLYR